MWHAYTGPSLRGGPFLMRPSTGVSPIGSLPRVFKRTIEGLRSAPMIAATVPPAGVHQALSPIGNRKRRPPHEIVSSSGQGRPFLSGFGCGIRLESRGESWADSQSACHDPGFPARISRGRTSRDGRSWSTNRRGGNGVHDESLDVRCEPIVLGTQRQALLTDATRAARSTRVPRRRRSMYAQPTIQPSRGLGLPIDLACPHACA